MRALIARAATSVRRQLLERGGVVVERIDHEDRRFRTALVDDTVPLPAGATARLRADHPRLGELRMRSASADAAVRVHSRWDDSAISWLDFARFRGDNAYVWQYRESLRVTELKFLVYAQYVRSRDEAGLLDRLVEDGAFGCWTYDFEGLPRLSRDLLDSVNELAFLDRHLGVLAGSHPRVLDIGAGYGRMAHRMIEAVDGIDDYCCTDAVPESTFLAEYYLEHRSLSPPARVAALDEVTSLEPGTFDLAMNIHSWSECPLAAVEWWVEQLARLEVPRVFVVPNEAEGFVTFETDRSRRDYLGVLEAAGYELVVDEPAFADPAVRSALGVADRHCLFERSR